MGAILLIYPIFLLGFNHFGPKWSHNKQFTKMAEDEFFDFQYTEGTVCRVTKNGVLKKRNTKDSLPFRVFEIDTEKEIGTYKLDGSTSCGDILQLPNASSESSYAEKRFEVQRVTLVYKYKSNGFQVFMKKIHVTECELRDEFSDQIL